MHYVKSLAPISDQMIHVFLAFFIIYLSSCSLPPEMKGCTVELPPNANCKKILGWEFFLSHSHARDKAFNSVKFAGLEWKT